MTKVAIPSPCRTALLPAILIVAGPPLLAARTPVGCYDVELGEWSPVLGPQTDSLLFSPPSRIVFDTTLVGEWEERWDAGYRSLRVPDGALPSIHDHAGWIPQGDSIRLAWSIGTGSGVRAVVGEVPEGFAGEARTFLDFHPHQGQTAPITLRRVSCDSPPPITTQTASPSKPTPEHALIQQAALRWLAQKAEQHPSGALKTACFVVPDMEGEPKADAPAPAMDRESLTRFVDQALGLRARPRSGCEIRQAEWRNSMYSLYFDVETGEPATLLIMTNPDVPEPLKAIIHLAFIVGDRWGENFACEVERREESWEVHECQRTGIW